jgi:hypothetical protein
MFSTTHTVDASLRGLEQMRHVSVSEMLWHTLQYFTSCFSFDSASQKASTSPSLLFQEVQHQTQCRLAAYAGQFGKFVDGTLQQCRWILRLHGEQQLG